MGDGFSLVDADRDALYNYDAAAVKELTDKAPWKSDPTHFKNVRISAVAYVKMVMHARSGRDMEVMGLMQGHVQHETFIVTDALRLPVEGTETRVNAQDEANEYLITFLDSARQAGQVENVVGWYHSHPGYGCWLSKIDIDTQVLQQYSGPMVAVVIDPHRTVSSGKVDIGAFRTYPEGHKATERYTGAATIRTDKAADFGAFAHLYYSLEVSHFKSTLESKLLQSLWNKYWVQTLSSTPLSSNRDYTTSQIQDAARKTNRATEDVKYRTKNLRSALELRENLSSRPADLEQAVKAAEKITVEDEMGLMAATTKEKIFLSSAVGGDTDTAMVDS
ncbi:Mov34/MPN/PAD-1 family protein [Piedraia hortae CBS 480.64]|uniref:COP9 signalosome complex subunit 5 n=1 Tax=Piedraia hortae CBS 480.64 TaxID=1314780 RepID=A0A6A7BXB4_9PEZI|nr:Mov34/MPN/PAD-1 family protein [Piedraia hortae CBS 480.64]